MTRHDIAKRVLKVHPKFAATQEVKQYLELPSVEQGTNPLLWWKDHKEMFPNIYRVVKRWLAVPATSVAVESLFSEAGLTITKLRNRLSPKTAGVLIFLCRNKRYW